MYELDGKRANVDRVFDVGYQLVLLVSRYDGTWFVGVEALDEIEPVGYVECDTNAAVVEWTKNENAEAVLLYMTETVKPAPFGGTPEIRKRADLYRRRRIHEGKCMM